MVDNLKIKQILERDSVLKNIIQTIPEPQIQSTDNVFHDLMSCILEQQIHYRSTKKIFQKMLNAASLEILTLENFAQFEEKVFQNTNFSMTKYETIERTIDFFNENNRATNRIDWQELKDEEIVQKLSSIKGIGKWTIDMILLYTLERPNVFPFDDFHLKNMMVKLYNLNEKSKLKAQMLEVASHWGEYQSLATLYILAYKKFL